MVDHVINPFIVHTTAVVGDEALRRHPVIGRIFEDSVDRKGGALALMSRESGLILLNTAIGDCPAAKLDGRMTRAKEKVTRLHSLLDRGHVLSYQSRDPEKDMWGGAIAGMRYLYGFSGYPEDVDEIAMLALAYRVGDITYADVVSILRQRDTPNRYFEDSLPEKDLIFARKKS